MAKVGITETICRDAHQSLIATRMTTEEMLPALPLMDKVGYHSLEVWGGATFDACLRFLNEDPGRGSENQKSRSKDKTSNVVQRSKRSWLQTLC